MRKTVNLLGTGEKKWSCELLPYNFSSRSKTSKQKKQTNRQTNKQKNQLTLTVSCEKTSCFVLKLNLYIYDIKVNTQLTVSGTDRIFRIFPSNVLEQIKPQPRDGSWQHHFDQ